MNFTDDNENIINKCESCHRQLKSNYINCKICRKNYHIKCTGIDKKVYDKIQNNDETVFCSNCNEELLPFFPSKNEINKKNNVQLSESIKVFFKEINNFNEKERDEDNAPLLNCNYVDFESFNHKNKSKDF